MKRPTRQSSVMHYCGNIQLDEEIAVFMVFFLSSLYYQRPVNLTDSLLEKAEHGVSRQRHGPTLFRTLV